MFGNAPCGSKTSALICMQTDTAVAGTFVGTNGDFLACVSDRFLVMSPTVGITLENTMFPSSHTHQIVACKPGKTYAVTPGTSIITHSKGVIESVTFFLGGIDAARGYNLCNRFLMLSLFHHRAVADAMKEADGFNLEQFKSEKIKQPAYDALKVCMPRCILPVAVARPVDMDSVAEAVRKRLANETKPAQADTKRQKAV